MDERDMSDQPTPMLPNEVLLKIMQYLDEASDLLSVGGVCRRWRLVSEQNILWKPLCKHVTALTQEQQQTCDQTAGYKALYWRQKWCSGDEAQCEDIELKYEVPQGGDTAIFRGQCLAVTGKYIFGCFEQNRDKLIVWSSSGIGKELVDLSVPHIPAVFVTHCVVSSDQKFIVLVTHRSNIAHVFDIGSGRRVHELRHPGQINKIWIHKNYLFVYIRKWKYAQFVWNIDTGVQLYQWPGLFTLPDAVVVFDGNLALVCHMQLDTPGRWGHSNLRSLGVYDLTTGDNIVRKCLVPAPAYSTFALSESKSTFAYMYDHGFIAVHDFGQDIVKRGFVDKARYMCIQGDYLFVADDYGELKIFQLSKMKPHVPGGDVRFPNIPVGYACVIGVFDMRDIASCQSMYPLWCGLVVTVNDNAVNLWDIVNMRFVKTLVKLRKGQKIKNIHISGHKVKCIVSDCSQPNIKCIQLNMGPCVHED